MSDIELRIGPFVAGGLPWPVSQGAVAAAPAIRWSGCQNCGRTGTDRYEISRLVEDRGEVTDADLLTILSLCEECSLLISKGDWSQLALRSRRRGRN